MENIQIVKFKTHKIAWIVLAIIIVIGSKNIYTSINAKSEMPKKQTISKEEAKEQLREKHKMAILKHGNLTPEQTVLEWKKIDEQE